MIWSAQFDAPVNDAHAVCGNVSFVCGDGFLRTVSGKLEEAAFRAHDGAILSSAIAKDWKLLTGGDDGRLALTEFKGTTQTLQVHKDKWVDCVAAAPNGSIAWSTGRRCFYQSRDGTIKSLDCPNTPAAMVFDPKGRRVAVALYGGVWLWLPKDKENLVRKLEWKGSHLHVTWSPDGDYVATSMQENELHGWRLSDRAHMRMAGYPAKIHSLSWDSTGKSLATSGAPVATVWPFGSEGPWDKRPVEAGFLPAGITQVKWHPFENVLAIGCAVGAVMLIRMTDFAEIVVRNKGDGSVSSLCWLNNGTILAVGTTSGKAELHSLLKD